MQPLPASAPRLPVDGAALHALVAELLPLRRCITGEGLRQTLALLAERLAGATTLHCTEVPTRTGVLDWTIPPEWRVKKAYLATPRARYAEWAASPLHLVQYSRPAHARLPLRALRPRLHTLPGQPALVPYRTAYYDEGAWGFCLSEQELEKLAADVGEGGEVEAVVDADLFEGSLTYGEAVIAGDTSDEVLFSAHACHPALANDNAAALAVLVGLAHALAARPPLRYTYRILVAPGTIGAIAWLAKNRAGLGRIRHGLVLANLGDGGGLTYKQTRAGTLGPPLALDRAVEEALGPRVAVRPFSPDGYDERQFGSPGFNLPVGCLTRTPHGEYPEYHTSGDNLALVRPESLADSLDALLRIVDALEAEASALDTEASALSTPQPEASSPLPGYSSDLSSGLEPLRGGGGEGAGPRPEARFKGARPYGEPMLSRYGLYQTPEGRPTPPELLAAMRWTLNLADGRHTLAQTAAHSGLSPQTVLAAARRLQAVGLILPA